jgi:hypothetical protein
MWAPDCDASKVSCQFLTFRDCIIHRPRKQVAARIRPVSALARAQSVQGEQNGHEGCARNRGLYSWDDRTKNCRFFFRNTGCALSLFHRITMRDQRRKHITRSEVSSLPLQGA